MKQIFNRLTTFLLSLAAALSITGCAGYQLGSMLPSDVQSVYVPTFVNETEEPLLEFETTQAVIEALQTDGSLKVVSSEEEADAVLLVDITGYKLDPVSFDRARRSLGREYRLQLTSRILMLRTDNREILARHPIIKGESTFPFTGDLTSSKLSGLPIAADDLAHDIVEQVVETWQ